MVPASENSLQSSFLKLEDVPDTVAVTTTPPLANPPGFRFFFSPSQPNHGTIGGMGGMIMGSLWDDGLGILDLPGTITLDPSFNRGADLIVLAHTAEDWSIYRDGSIAVLSDGDTNIEIPVGAGSAVSIGGEIRFLKFEAATGNMLLGNQIVDTTRSPIESPPFDGIWMGPDALGGEGVSHLFLYNGSEVAVGGSFNVNISGSNDGDHVIFKSGKATFDASFNRGGDVISLSANAGEVTASLSGSSVHLKSIGPHAYFDLMIPVGVVGLTLDFADGERTLVYDRAQDHFLIGDQVITADTSALFAFG